MATLLLSLVPLAAAAYAESNLALVVGAPAADALHGPIRGLPVPVSRAVGAVVAVNVVGSAVLLVLLGVRVGRAREKYGVKLPVMCVVR